MRTLREKQQQINDEIHTLSLRFVAVIVYALVFESKNIERKKYFFFFEGENTNNNNNLPQEYYQQ